MRINNTPVMNALENGVSNGDIYAPLEDVSFARKMVSEGFKMACEAFKDDIAGHSDKEVVNEFNRLLGICIKKEQNLRPQLEQLCYNAVVSCFNIPTDTMDFELNLVDSVDPMHEFHITPNTNEDFEYDSVQSIDLEKKEVDKRKAINILVQGITDDVFETAMSKCVSDIFKLDEELPHLYSKLVKVNRYLLYAVNTDITDKEHHQGGYVEVRLGNDLRVSSIKTEAMVFPILLSETIKGVMEVVSSNGLPDDISEAKNVIDKADTLAQEPWNMRMGLPLWKHMLFDNNIDSKLIPSFFDVLIKSDADSFLELLNEIIHSTKVGKSVIKNIITSVEYDSKYNDFLDDIMKKHTEKQVIDEVEFVY